MKSYMQANQDNWDERVPIHAKSSNYNVEGFKKGKSSLLPTEINELGDVRGKKLLHLQCHFGLDSLSWARMGAKVTGIDFSKKAITLARSLALELDINADFIDSNLFDLRDNLDDKFDIVYTSYGVLCWLADLKKWAETINHYLKPGGFFYIVEDHPLAAIYEETEGKLVMEYSYFYQDDPLQFEEETSYAGEEKLTKNKITYEWNHHLGEIICEVIDTGLKLEYVHEFPHCAWQRFPSMKKDSNGKWWLPNKKNLIPMTFSMKATKPL